MLQLFIELAIRAWIIWQVVLENPLLLILVATAGFGLVWLILRKIRNRK